MLKTGIVHRVDALLRPPSSVGIDLTGVGQTGRQMRRMLIGKMDRRTSDTKC